MRYNLLLTLTLTLTPYHSSKLHPDPCSGVGMRRGTDTPTHSQTAVVTMHFAWLCLMRYAISEVLCRATWSSADERWHSEQLHVGPVGDRFALGDVVYRHFPLASVAECCHHNTTP